MYGFIENLWQIQNLDKAANGVTLSDPESIAVTFKNIENYFVYTTKLY